MRKIQLEEFSGSKFFDAFFQNLDNESKLILITNENDILFELYLERYIKINGLDRSNYEIFSPKDGEYNFEEIRTIMDRLGFASNGSEIVGIKKFDSIDKSGYDLMLKIFEEINGYKIFLQSRNIDALPKTILGRIDHIIEINEIEMEKVFTDLVSEEEFAFLKQLNFDIDIYNKIIEMNLQKNYNNLVESLKFGEKKNTLSEFKDISKKLGIKERDLLIKLLPTIEEEISMLIITKKNYSQDLIKWRDEVKVGLEFKTSAEAMLLSYLVRREIISKKK